MTEAIDIANFKIHDLGTKVNPMPIDFYRVLRIEDIPDVVNQAVKLLSALEGRLDGTVHISRLLLPHDVVYNFLIIPLPIVERHFQSFIAVIAEYNWIAIDTSCLKKETPSLDENCQKGLHLTQGTDCCVNCGLRLPEGREIHQKDRSDTSAPDCNSPILGEEIYNQPQFDSKVVSSEDDDIRYYHSAENFLGEMKHEDFPNNWTKLKVLMASFLHDQSTSNNTISQAREYREIDKFLQGSAYWQPLSSGEYRSDFVIQTLKQAQLKFSQLSIEEFAKASLDRCDRPKPQGFGGHQNWMPDSWTNAICGEAGEAANKAKKFSKRTEDFENVGAYEIFCKMAEGQELLRGIAVELADTIIYAMIAIQKFGFNPAEILTTTFNTVSERENMPFKI